MTNENIAELHAERERLEQEVAIRLLMLHQINQNLAEAA